MSTADLSSLMTKIAPRERSGSQTAARYDFQANFGIMKVVDLREAKQDFRIIFDIFDDIMVLDSAAAPTQARFYQLKSKDPGDWTISDICKKIGATVPRSIISRLYAHVVSFAAAVEETGLVSNAPYRVKLLDGTTSSGAHHRIAGTELHADETSKLTTAVEDDVSPADVPAWLPKLALIRTTLGVHGQDLVVIGRLQQHLEQSEGAGTVKTSALYQTLHASIVQRTTFSQEGIDHSELLSRKSLTRDEVEDLLARACGRSRSIVEDWEIIRADLIQSGQGSVAQIKIKTAAIGYSRDRNSGRAHAGRLSAFATDWMEKNKTEVDNCQTILAIAEKMRAVAPEQFGYRDLELLAALIVEAYEGTNGAA